MFKKFFITKASGDKELFSLKKLEESMRAAEVSNQNIKKVVNDIKLEIKPGLTTAEIHRLAFNKLKTENKTQAARYNLKKAIMSLGPDGFPFEEYVTALLSYHGYKCITNMIANGKCITHEVDVIAEKSEQNIHAIIECKFHSRSGMRTRSKDALYTYARFLDIREYWLIKKKLGAKPAKGILQCWLVTNTKLTSEAISYCNCIGIKAIAWSYPSRENGLQGLIQNKGLYPITALVSLGIKQRKELLKRNIVLCKQLLKSRRVLKLIGTKENIIKKILAEADTLCKEN